MGHDAPDAGGGEVVRLADRDGPDLPYLLSRSRDTDVRSSALALLIVVGVAVCGAFTAELGKLGRTQRWRIPAIFVFQLVLVADGVRAYARDWWTYFAVVLQHRYPELYEPAPVSAVRWPWISCVLAIALIAAIVVPSIRKRPPA